MKFKCNCCDGIKVFGNYFKKPKNKYGVIYENGELMKGWI